MERWRRRMLLLLQRREAAAIRRPRAVPAAATAPDPAPDDGDSSNRAWGEAMNRTAEEELGGFTVSTTTALPEPLHDGAVLDTEQKCVDYYRNQTQPEDHCRFTWDTYLCWPPTPSNETVTQFCPGPDLPDVDPTKLVSKRCVYGSQWEGFSNASAPWGYTEYSVCYRDEIKKIIDDIFCCGREAGLAKLRIVSNTRALEMVGLSVSLAALLVSLAIFFHFRSLRNNRTRIHKNLFIAMLMQVVIRLTLYIDKGVTPPSSMRAQGFVHTTPVLCEASYVLMEYARTAMFLWMFIEGLYLHNMVTVTVFQETFYYSLYTLVGWGVPVIMTTCWAVTTALQLEEKCFRNYNLKVFFWILEGPRLGVIVLNFLFLLNIIRVLVVKLRQSRTSEMEQVRKAVRAALVLLPLLGITNLTNMMPPPLRREVWEVAVWFYATNFLTSFQGLFIACLYCFLNGEVRLAVMQRVYRYLSLRPHHFQPRRNSAFSGVYVTAEPEAGLPRHLTVELDVAAADGVVVQPRPPKPCARAPSVVVLEASAPRTPLALLCCGRPGPRRASPRRPEPVETLV